MTDRPYVPETIDTSSVKVTTEIGDLIEKLAKNTHEVWAKKRISEGWKFGPQRNDERKEHPGLVPYEKLDEIERGYDRETATQVVKVLLALGYKISR